MTDANHQIPAADHQVWPFLRFLVVGVVLTIVLAVNATDFDESEARAITAFLTLYGGYEASMRWMQKPTKTEGEE